MVLLVITTAITIGLSIATVIAYFRTTDSRFQRLSTLLQTIFVFITLNVAIYTIYSSDSDTQKLFENLQRFNDQFENMESSMDDVSQKLKILPNQIEAFSKSLDTLNSIAYRQSEDFKMSTTELNTTIDKLATSAKNYEENISNYSSSIERLVDLTDQQLLILKEQQRLLLDEYSRRPEFKLETKPKYSNDTCEIVSVVLKNDGNIEANVRSIFLFVPSQSVIVFHSQAFQFYKTDWGYNQYLFHASGTNAETIAAGASISIPFSMKIYRGNAHNIGFRVDYYSKYQSGLIPGVLAIK